MYCKSRERKAGNAGILVCMSAESANILRNPTFTLRQPIFTPRSSVPLNKSIPALLNAGSLFFEAANIVNHTFRAES
jgi:hypothetical protein